jgi:hypothetical protein
MNLFFQMKKRAPGGYIFQPRGDGVLFVVD